jgi:hypothetical protein
MFCVCHLLKQLRKKISNAIEVRCNNDYKENRCSASLLPPNQQQLKKDFSIIVADNDLILLNFSNLF